VKTLDAYDLKMLAAEHYEVYVNDVAEVRFRHLKSDDWQLAGIIDFRVTSLDEANDAIADGESK
jgi:hypothetical protein